MWLVQLFFVAPALEGAAREGGKGKSVRWGRCQWEVEIAEIEETL